MFKRIAPLLICLMAATVAVAQPGGRGKGGPSGARPPPAARANFKPLEIVGVVKAVDTDTGRITIAYETVEALNWPPGTQPFPVAKTALLSGVTVGLKVRFSLDSGAIAAIRPFDQ
jgi:Cu/Ag efflux protein CusF